MRRVAGAVALGFTTLSSTLSAQALPPLNKPTLVVFFTVDQMRPDYVDRWGSQYTGGLARLGKHGAFFTNAFHDHAVTETAPGHSVTMSGRFPRGTGIISNTNGVSDIQSPLLTSRDAPASPNRFRGSVLMDWLRARDTRSRGLSISRKDRGAILPMGRAKQSVFWYATTLGEFTTSRYYADTLPDWIKRVNARRVPQRSAGKVWDLLLPASAYAEPDSESVERNGANFTFPHVLHTDTVRAAADFPYNPWMDELTFAAALEGLQALNLGNSSSTDILAISLSGSDHIGHTYGPDSREQHDNYLRLDRAMGAFMDSLFKLRDSADIVFALTADHGVTPYPELVAKRKNVAPPARYDIRPAVRSMRAELRAADIDTMAISMDGPLVIVDRDVFAGRTANPDEILKRFGERLRATPGVARVEMVRDFAKKDTIRDPVMRRWIHMLPADVEVEMVWTPAEGLYSTTYTSAFHGAPWDSDAHVPVIFYGPWFKAGRYTERALVADMAPTLAKIAGVPPTEKLDGRVLQQAILSPPK